MKKSSFVALMLGTVSGVLFALGMCMALLPEWNAFKPGVVFGCIGLVLGLVTVHIWRKMENKAPIRLDRKKMLIAAMAIACALVLGLGMCFCMVWNKMVIGIIIGIVGILGLLMLIPMVKGIK